MNHFHFSSNVVMETIGFYESYFGFRKARVLGKTHVLVNQDRFLLAIDEAPVPVPLPPGVHLGFSLSTVDMVRSLYEKMRNESTAGELMEPSPRAVHFYCVDPSGNRIEVGWYQI